MENKFEVGEDGIYEILQEDKHWSACKLVIPKETFIEAYNKYIVKLDDADHCQTCEYCGWAEELYDNTGYLCKKFDLSRQKTDYCSDFYQHTVKSDGDPEDRLWIKEPHQK